MTQQLLFQREILIDAPLSDVWQLVGTEEGLRQWWGNTIYIEAKEGGRCEEWRPRQGVSTHWRGVVTLYAPPRELMLTLRAQDEQVQGPEFTTIAIALAARGDKTLVQVSQRAFGTAQAVATPDAKEAQPNGNAMFRLPSCSDPPLVNYPLSRPHHPAVTLTHSSILSPKLGKDACPAC